MPSIGAQALEPSWRGFLTAILVSLKEVALIWVFMAGVRVIEITDVGFQVECWRLLDGRQWYSVEIPVQQVDLRDTFHAPLAFVYGKETSLFCTNF